MKTKTIKQINEQTQRLLAPLFGCGILTAEQLARLRRISAIAKRYNRNALAYIRSRLSPIELDEYWKVTGVPVSVYAKSIEK